MDIDNMPAGREMDALISEQMGYKAYKETRGEFILAVMQRPGSREPWECRQTPDPERYTQISCIEAARLGFFGSGFPDYSTDISAAWEVVKHMKEQGWSFRFSNNAHADGQNAAAFFQGYRGLGRDILNGDYVYDDKAWAVDDECPAICRAALKALGAS